MMWVQAGLSFLIWIAYGWSRRRMAGEMQRKMEAMPYSRRVLLGSAGMIGSMIGLFAGLGMIGALGGVHNRVMTWWAWPIVTVLGLGFVHMQILGAGAMVTIVQQDRRTPRGHDSSDSNEVQSK